MQTDESQKIYLTVDRKEEEEDTIDLFNIAANIGKKKKFYGYLLVFAMLAGLLVGLLILGVQILTGVNAYARAVISFQYDGIDEGRDPNGASFDINKLKAPTVIQAAFDELGITDEELTIEDVRQGISIEGVIPEDALERITAYNQMAEDDASNYEKILDVSYYPSQYIVYLEKLDGMSGTETSEILNAVLAAYKEWFLYTYANTAVLSVAGSLVDYESYDYIEAIDLLSSQIEIMKDYVSQRQSEASDFRSSRTGLSFGDIQTSLSAITNVNLSSLQSYVESNNVTKDKDYLLQYYDYHIRQYNLSLSTLQAELTEVQSTIDSYQKDPTVIVSNQDSAQEFEQKNAYYDTLIAQKLNLTEDIAQTTTRINRLTQLRAGLADGEITGDPTRADEMLATITNLLNEWSGLIEETADEYYETVKFSNAYKITIPAQWQSFEGGLTGACKTIGICMGAGLFVVLFVWCLDGLVTELKNSRKQAAAKEVSASGTI